MQYVLQGIINSLGKPWFVWRLNTNNTSEIDVIDFHNIPLYGGSCADVARRGSWLLPDADIGNIESAAINMKCETTDYLDIYNKNDNHHDRQHADEYEPENTPIHAHDGFGKKSRATCSYGG